MFKDGSFLQADAVIFATGYEPVRNAILPIFGEELACKITPVWGFNEVHELRRSFSPSGHPGVSSINCLVVEKRDSIILQIWWAVGDLGISRYGSKTLVSISRVCLWYVLTETSYAISQGIQIKARLLGMVTDEDEASNRCYP